MAISPEVYSLLVRDRGWSPDDYQRWLADKLITALVPDGLHGNGPGPGRGHDVLGLTWH